MHMCEFIIAIYFLVGLALQVVGYDPAVQCLLVRAPSIRATAISLLQSQFVLVGCTYGLIEAVGAHRLVGQRVLGSASHLRVQLFRHLLIVYHHDRYRRRLHLCRTRDPHRWRVYHPGLTQHRLHQDLRPLDKFNQKSPSLHVWIQSSSIGKVSLCSLILKDAPVKSHRGIVSVQFLVRLSKEEAGDRVSA